MARAPYPPNIIESLFHTKGISTVDEFVVPELQPLNFDGPNPNAQRASLERSVVTAILNFETAGEPTVNTRTRELQIISLVARSKVVQFGYSSEETEPPALPVAVRLVLPRDEEKGSLLRKIGKTIVGGPERGLEAMIFLHPDIAVASRHKA